jgi:hypothetical protein
LDLAKKHDGEMRGGIAVRNFDPVMNGESRL